LEEGIISPMKSRPHCKKEASPSTGIRGRAASFCFHAKIWQGIQLHTFKPTWENNLGQ